MPPKEKRGNILNNLLGFQEKYKGRQVHGP